MAWKAFHFALEIDLEKHADQHPRRSLQALLWCGRAASVAPVMAPTLCRLGSKCSDLNEVVPCEEARALLCHAIGRAAHVPDLMDGKLDRRTKNILSLQMVFRVYRQPHLIYYPHVFCLLSLRYRVECGRVLFLTCTLVLFHQYGNYRFCMYISRYESVLNTLCYAHPSTGVS